jgi:hypothetical protein
VTRQVGTAGVYRLYDRGEICLRGHPDTNGPSRSRLLYGLCCPKQCLRGNAARVETVAAQPCTLEDGDPGAEPCRTDGTHEAASTATDDHEVVE